MICINTAGDLPQIRRSGRSWHTKTVRQIQRMDLVTSPRVFGVWKDKRGANNPFSGCQKHMWKDPKVSDNQVLLSARKCHLLSVTRRWFSPSGSYTCSLTCPQKTLLKPRPVPRPHIAALQMRWVQPVLKSTDLLLFTGSQLDLIWRWKP